MRADELEQPRIDRWPDRPQAPTHRPAADRVDHRPPAAPAPPFRLDRTVDLQIETLAKSRHRRSSPASGPDHEARDLLERALGRRQADPLERRPGSQFLEPLEGQRARDAHRAWSPRPRGSRRRSRLGVAKQLARPRRQHQVERLGRRDQDVRRVGAASPRARGPACRRCDRNADVETEATQRVANWRSMS